MSNADELKEKTKEKTEEAEKKVNEQVDKVENSKVGSKMPTQIKEIDLKGIIYANLMMIMFNTVPIYLFLGIADGMSTSNFKFIYKICKWALFFSGIVCVIFDAMVIAFKQRAFYKLSLIIKAVKISITILSLFACKFTSNIDRSLYIMYGLSCIMMDLVFIYYSSLYFKRLASDDFDDEGNPKKQDDNEQV